MSLWTLPTSTAPANEPTGEADPHHRLPSATRSRNRGQLSPRAQSAAVLVLRPWASWAAHVAIVGRSKSQTDPDAGRFTRGDVGRLLKTAWTRFDQLEPDLPPEPTVGSRQNVMLACLTLAMLEALVDDGIERSLAIELVGDTCWRIYAQWGQLPRAISWLTTRDPANRMRRSVNLFLRFPFNRPGYRYDDVPEPQGRAINMLRCPVADYLAAHNASDLTVGTWCNLDYQLAHMWGGTLERHGTIAAGAQHCDFRFRTAAQPVVDGHTSAGQAPSALSDEANRGL